MHPEPGMQPQPDSQEGIQLASESGCQGSVRGESLRVVTALNGTERAHRTGLKRKGVKRIGVEGGGLVVKHHAAVVCASAAARFISYHQIGSMVINGDINYYYTPMTITYQSHSLFPP